MKAFLRRLLGKFKRQPAKPAPPQKQEPRPKKRTDSSFEPLEGRIAPAMLLSPTTVQFTDVDGDLVTVKFSKALFTKTGSALDTQLDSVFKFKDPSQHVRTAAGGGSPADVNELALLDIYSLFSPSGANPVAGLGISITATPHAGSGNDLVNVGYIRAASGTSLGTTLGAVVVDGDLGQIDAGDPFKAMGVASLTVQSMGLQKLTTQGANGSLESNITGALGKLVVKGDFVDSVLKVVTGLPNKSAGKIGSITIGGSLKVSDGTTTADIALISAADAIGTVKIGTTSSDGIFGGVGVNSAMIKSSSKIGNITISGDLRGGLGKDSGEINGLGGIGNVTLLGSLWAGTGENSGRITSNGNIGTVKMTTLHGESAFPRLGADGADPDTDPDVILDAAGKNAATVFAGGNLAGFTTSGAVLGGFGEGAGSVNAGGTLGKISVGTVLVGGVGKNSGRFNAGAIGTVFVGETLTGGVGASSGSIASLGNMGSVTVQNTQHAPAALIAGKGSLSASITSIGNMGVVKITGALDGTGAGTLHGQLVPEGTPPVDTAQLPGLGAASVQTKGNITSFTLTGQLMGGLTEATGSIIANGNIGTLKITGNLMGNGGLNSGGVIVGGKITSATIIGSLIGGAGENSGALVVGLDSSMADDLTKATITGVLTGGDGVGSGSLRVGGKLGTLTLGTFSAAGVPLANVLKGSGNAAGGGSGSIFANGGMGAVTIIGNVVGGAAANSGAIIASGPVSSIKIFGALAGSVGDGSGSIQVRDLDLFTSFRPGDLGTLSIDGAVIGNAGAGSGQIVAEGSVKSITVEGVLGGTGINSGRISVGTGPAALIDDHTKIGGAGSITIKGALTGTNAAGTGTVEVGAQLGSLTIDGAVTKANILVGRDLAKLKIGGAVEHTLVSALGKVKPTSKTDLTIGSITIQGAVSDSLFKAGYDRFGNAMNGGAQIGAVSVTGNWTASSIAAGMEDVDGDGFGDGDDTAIATAGPISKIASIIITGQVTGTVGGPDHFGFTAHQVVSMKIGGVAQALTTGTETIDLAGNPVTNDTSIREVA